MLNSKILKPMGYACCFFFILCFVAIIYYILSDDDHVCKFQRSDFMVLALDVLPTSCLKSRCSRIRDRKNVWGIHGLWPSSYRSNIEFCCRSQTSKCCDTPNFNVTSLSPILSQLKSSWPTVKGADEKFWTHEWDKHGTCATRHRELTTQLQYFNKSLELYRSLGIQSLLEKANITPTRDLKVTVNLQTLKNVIESNLKARVYILCKQMGPNFYGSPKHNKDPNLLSGIRVCLNNKFEPINCKSSFRGCKSQVTYPNFGFNY